MVLINRFNLVIVTLIQFLSLSAFSQKLPNKQENSFRAPKNIKIDGKLDEWGESLKAYNVTNRLFYTIANDDNKLYLTIAVNDAITVDKILEGGITFTVNNLSDQKKEKTDTLKMSVMLPVMTWLESENIRLVWHNYLRFHEEGNHSLKEIDSVGQAINKKISTAFKEMRVTGLKAMEQPVLSIYNELGITAGFRFDSKMSFNLELAIPLKYLDIPNRGAGLIKYNIKLNGPIERPVTPGARRPPGKVSNPAAPINHDVEFEKSPTDFWAEYRLAQ